MENGRVSVLVLVCAMALFVASASGAAFAAANGDSGKSNTGRVTAGPAHPCTPGMGKGCATTSATASHYDPGSAQLVGRRMHTPITVRRKVDSASPSLYSAAVTGRSAGGLAHRTGSIHRTVDSASPKVAYAPARGVAAGKRRHAATRRNPQID